MISKLHYITQDIVGKSHVQLTEEACAAGADWVQLRVKNKPQTEWQQIAVEALAVCNKYGAKLIINDNFALAKEIGAHGVHLGKQDMSTLEARKYSGPDFIIGGTANTFEDIQMHAAAGVNYIGLGPYRFTATKEKLSPVLGLEGYRTIVEKCRLHNINIPIIAIGGIKPDDVAAIVSTGVYGVAVASEIGLSVNKRHTIELFKETLQTKLVLDNEK